MKARKEATAEASERAPVELANVDGARTDKSPACVDWYSLLNTFEYVSSGGGGENYAYLCKQSGELLWHSEFGDNIEELPDDIDDDEKYIPIPDKRELDLGKPLVFDFVREFLPADFDEIRRIFSRRGAYARFKTLLHYRNAVDQWHDFENKATEHALRTWCELNEIAISE